MYSKLFFSLSFGSLLALIFCIFPRSRVWIPLLDQLSGLGISLLAVHGIPLLAAAVLLLLFAAAPLIHNLKPVISALSSSISYNQTRHTFFFSGLMLSLSSLYFLISLSDLFFSGICVPPPVWVNLSFSARSVLWYSPSVVLHLFFFDVLVWCRQAFHYSCGFFHPNRSIQISNSLTVSPNWYFSVNYNL